MNKRDSKMSGMEERPTGSVLVLYESPSARERAVSFYEPLGGQSDAAPRPMVKWYSFDHLSVPQKTEEVVRAAVCADLLAFVASSVGDFPAEIKSWTERWLVRRGDREGVLVGLFLAEGGLPLGSPCLKELYLRQLAHRAGMDYLSHFPGQIMRPIPDSLDSFSERAGRISPVLDEILHTHFVPPSLPLK